MAFSGGLIFFRPVGHDDRDVMYQVAADRAQGDAGVAARLRRGDGRADDVNMSGRHLAL